MEAQEQQELLVQRDSLEALEVLETQEVLEAQVFLELMEQQDLLVLMGSQVKLRLIFEFIFQREFLISIEQIWNIHIFISSL